MGGHPRLGVAFYWVHYPLQNMIEALVVLLVILWLLGMFTSYTLGGLIHLLLVIALIAIVFRLVSGRLT